MGSYSSISCSPLQTAKFRENLEFSSEATKRSAFLMGFQPSECPFWATILKLGIIHSLQTPDYRAGGGKQKFDISFQFTKRSGYWFTKFLLILTLRLSHWARGIQFGEIKVTSGLQSHLSFWMQNILKGKGNTEGANSQSHLNRAANLNTLKWISV